MKKLVCLLLVFAFMLSLVACGGTDVNSDLSSVNDVIANTDVQSEIVESEPVESEPAESKPSSAPTQNKPVEQTPAHTHSYSATVTKAPTCGKTGVKTFKCSCGRSYTEAVAATGAHNWAAASCKDPKTCTVCRATEGAKGPHGWLPATCKAPKTCAVCGTTEGSKLSHDWTNATCKAPRTCTICGETLGGTSSHDWEYATCTEPKTCKECGKTEGEAEGHDYESYNGYKCECGALDPEAEAALAKCSLTINALPKKLSYRGYDNKIRSTVEVTDITYKFEYEGDGNISLIVYFSGTKIYDENGAGQSDECLIGWKLYDEAGNVHDTGTFYSPSVAEGESFTKKEENIIWGSDSVSAGAFRLEILDSN